MRRESYVFYIACLLFDLFVTLKYGNPKGEANSVIKWLLNYYDFSNSVIIYTMLEFILVSVVFSLFLLAHFYWTPILLLVILGVSHIQGALTWVVNDVEIVYKVPIIITIVFFALLEIIKLSKQS